MPNRRGHRFGPRRCGAGRRAALSTWFAALALLAACAAPDQPRPPSESEPNAAGELRIHQSGMAVVLHFTLPEDTAEGKPLIGPLRVEIQRVLAPTSSPAPAAGAPASAVSTKILEAADLVPYLAGRDATVPDELAPEEFQALLNKAVTYRVRIAAGGSAWSPPSNAASITLVEPPAPPTDLAATVVAGGITLRWSPAVTRAGPAPADYILYRAVIAPATAAAASAAASTAQPAGVTAESSYHDTDVHPGTCYRYTVRSVASASGGQVESEDSAPVEIQFTGIGAPASPAGLVAVVVGLPAGSLEVDLSWAIAGERNLAGYNIYRSEQPGERGTQINRQLVVASAFRDTSVAPGRSYFYSVTAVDLAGEESLPSARVTANTPAPGSGAP